jgi:hypothetical protein
MRVVHEKMIEMIRTGKPGNVGGNTTLTKSACPFVMSVYLHGHHIADVANGYGNDDAPAVRFTLAGWPTRTTRARINALLSEFASDDVNHFYVCQRKDAQIFGTGCDEREISSTEWVPVPQTRVQA